ncbi:glycosyltransferase [Namhaeicola litoreus]|uniref:Glycosyltransferase n=1 Tax=Namhaeicola litoreus TaxID=1052145 RepID=A0ABW3Y2A2_9FLAO
MPKIIVSVSNDLSTDQRLKKVCETLQKSGFEIVLVGRKLPNSMALVRSYQTIRINNFFNKGFLFYAEFNLRLFFKLMKLNGDILLSNDLDTLLPNYIVSKLNTNKLVYDSHEIFTEVPELNNRPFVKRFWLKLEQRLLPRLTFMYTVNSQLAHYFSNKYHIPVDIVLNVPNRIDQIHSDQSFVDKVKAGKKMLIIQGRGLNIDRGLEESVLMMKYLDGCILYIIGDGDVISKIRKMIKDQELQDKVILLPTMNYDELIKYTSIADLGLTLDKPTCLNYEWSLPNKLFDYIQCRVPILASNRKLVSEIVLKHDIGMVVNSFDPEYLSTQVSHIFANEKLSQQWRANLEKIAPNYTWENQEKKLVQIFTS